MKFNSTNIPLYDRWMLLYSRFKNKNDQNYAEQKDETNLMVLIKNKDDLKF